MKNLSLFLVILLVSGTAFAQEKAPQQKVEKVFVSIEGMTWNGYRLKVEKGLRDAVGVTKAEVSLDKKVSYIEIDPEKTKLEKIEDVILNLGFIPNDRKPIKA